MFAFLYVSFCFFCLPLLPPELRHERGCVLLPGVTIEGSQSGLVRTLASTKPRVVRINIACYWRLTVRGTREGGSVTRGSARQQTGNRGMQWPLMGCWRGWMTRACLLFAEEEPWLRLRLVGGRSLGAVLFSCVWWLASFSVFLLLMCDFLLCVCCIDIFVIYSFVCCWTIYFLQVSETIVQVRLLFWTFLFHFHQPLSANVALSTKCIDVCPLM